MPTLRLPDGTIKQVSPGNTPRQVVEGIGKRLAQAAVAARVDGIIVDLDRELPGDEIEHSFQILTDQDPDALDVLRHSSAHVMARAVMRLFPKVQLAFGPTVENGFYYDIDSTPPIKEEDFPRIEEEMRKIVALAEPFERFERPTAEARGLVEDLKQHLKVEHIDDDLKKYPSLSFYRQGEFIDLCRGPHIPHAGKIGAIKVMSIAGAYWKNDATRKQLQRLYGTAFFSQKDLDAYLHKIEEAKKRDHRVLGKQLKLFTISQMVGSGLILWMPKGATVRGLLETFIKDELIKRGYQPVYTPHIGRLELYRTSGHFPYYRDAQYPPIYFHPAALLIDLAYYRMNAGELDEKKEREFTDFFKLAQMNVVGYEEAKSTEEKLLVIHNGILGVLGTFRDLHKQMGAYYQANTYPDRAKVLWDWLSNQEGYLLKPMNCPHHIQIYKAEPRSYRDLPVRLAEFGTVYRFEQTGELNGMTRVRGFTQDDAHLFMTPEQVPSEMRANIELVLFVLSSLGLNDYRVRIGLCAIRAAPSMWAATRTGPMPSAAYWTSSRTWGWPTPPNRVRQLFMGPKIDFVVRDCIGREWQLGTVQLDYNLPKRFDMEYIGADNKSHRPVMIHRAPFGSMERFMGILIEHFAGAFPAWLAPEQARVMTVSEKFADYAKKVEAELRGHEFRVQGDYRPEKIGFKIREAQLEKIPYMLVIGEKEQAAGTVAVRARAEGDLGAMPLAEFSARLEREVKEKRLQG